MIRGVPHVEFPRFGQSQNRLESVGHDDIEFTQHLISFPKIIHIALQLLEIAAHRAPGIGQEIGDHEDVTIRDHLILGGKGGTYSFAENGVI